MIKIRMELTADRMEDLVVEFRTLGWAISQGLRGEGTFTEPRVQGWYVVSDEKEMADKQPVEWPGLPRRKVAGDEPGERSYMEPSE